MVKFVPEQVPIPRLRLRGRRLPSLRVAFRGSPCSSRPSGFEEANGGAGFLSPSMRQSILWTASATQLGVQTLAWAWQPETGGFWRDGGFWLSMGAFVFFTTYLPLGDAWMHEEWHRAVLTRGGAESRNGVYGAELGAEIIYVDGVKDADLARLKDESPADFVRLMEAGLEGEVEVRRLMRRNNFFLGRPSTHDRFVWWVQGLNSAYYLAACANGWLDKELRGMEAEEADMDDRDFTGPDFSAWVYDLRRPDEPYGEGPRGRPHPSGTPGYRRYLASSDLTGAERDYLRLQAVLSLLNFASPQYWGPDWLPWDLPGSGRGMLWNAGLVHHLTPFGYSLGGDLFLKRGKWAWVLGVQGYVNSDWVSPGISGQLFRYPLQVGRQVVCLTGEASAWLQPEDLRFDAPGMLPGGSMLAGLALPFAGGIELWAEVDAKSEGWVPGNVYLDPAVQARAGLAWRL